MKYVRILYSLILSYLRFLVELDLPTVIGQFLLVAPLRVAPSRTNVSSRGTIKAIETRRP